MELMTSISSDRPGVSEHPWSTLIIILGIAWQSNRPDSAVHQFLDRGLGTDFLLHPNVRPAFNLVTSAARQNRSEHHQEFLECVAGICNATPADVTRVLRIANTADEFAELERLVAVKKIGLDGQFIDDAWDLIVQWLRSDVTDCTKLREDLRLLIGNDLGQYPWSTALQLCQLSESTGQSRLYTLVAVLKLRVQESDMRRAAQTIDKRPANPRRSRAKKGARHTTEPSTIGIARSSSRARKSSVRITTTETGLVGSTTPSQMSRTSTPSPPADQFPRAAHQLAPNQLTVDPVMSISQSTISSPFLEHIGCFEGDHASVEPEINGAQIDFSTGTPGVPDSGIHLASAASTQLDLAVVTDMYAYGTFSDLDVAAEGLALAFDCGDYAFDPSSSAVSNLPTLAMDLQIGNTRYTEALANDFSIRADWTVNAHEPKAPSPFSTTCTTPPSDSFPPTVDTSMLSAISGVNLFNFNSAQTWIAPDGLAPYIPPQASLPRHDINAPSNGTTSAASSAPVGNAPSLNAAALLSSFEDPGYSLSFVVAPLPTHSDFGDPLYCSPVASDDEPPPLIPSPDFDDEDECQEQIPDPNPTSVALVESVLRTDSQISMEPGNHESWRSLFWPPGAPLSFEPQDSGAQLTSFGSWLSETVNTLGLPATPPAHETTGIPYRTSASPEASPPEPTMEPSLKVYPRANAVMSGSQNSTIPESGSYLVSVKWSTEGSSGRDAPHQVDQVSGAHHGSLALPVSDSYYSNVSMQDESRVVCDLVNAMCPDKPIDRSAIQVSTMDESSLGETSSLLDVPDKDDPAQASEDQGTVTMTKKRRAGFSAAGDKRRKTENGFVSSESYVPSRCPCCNLPDVEYDNRYGRPEYWHASRRMWCTQEEFSGVTPEQIGAPPPIAQSFIFFDSWNHVIRQPNLCLSRMRQSNLSAASDIGRTAQSTPSCVTGNLIPTTLDAGLEMRQAAPPVRAFTAGRAHRRSQAACAFLGMLDIIGSAVVINPIHVCGLSPIQWNRLLRVCSLDDFANGMWWPRRTADYFHRFGMRFSLSAALEPGPAGQHANKIPDPPPSASTDSLPASSADAQPAILCSGGISAYESDPTLAGMLDAQLDLIRHLLARPDERSPAGRHTGSDGYMPCFLTAAPADELPLEPESRRSLYRPQHYLHLPSGNERPIEHFHFFVQHGVVEDQFVFQRVPSAEGNELALNGKDTYVNYDQNAILIFDAFPHPHGRSASGQQILSKPVLLVDPSAVANCERRLLSLRVWHHWRTSAPAPTQHRYQIGSQCRTMPSDKHLASACSSEPDDFLVVEDVFPSGRRPPSFAETVARPKATVYFMGVPWPTWKPGEDSAGIPETYEWLKGSHHVLLLWIASNLLFFVSLISFDSTLRAVHPHCLRLARMPWSTRLALYQVLWGGPTPIPRLNAAQLVTHERYEGLERRRPLIAALSQIVGVWPRVHLPLPPSPEQGQEAFLAFEHRVWAAFLVTWLDYLRRPPPFPVPIPKNLPAEYSHIVPATGG